MQLSVVRGKGPYKRVTTAGEGGTEKEGAGVLVLTGTSAGGYRECGLDAGTAHGLFALLAHLSVGLEWCPTEPTHLLSNIYKCQRVEARHTKHIQRGSRL